MIAPGCRWNCALTKLATLRLCARIRFCFPAKLELILVLLQCHPDELAARAHSRLLEEAL